MNRNLVLAASIVAGVSYWLVMGSGPAGPGLVAWKASGVGLLALWGLRIARMSVSEGEIGHSFMHPILLPFHEAGPILFMPLGSFMTIAGGTLGQLAVPLIVMIAFRRTTRDNFAAAIGLWSARQYGGISSRIMMYPPALL